MLTLLFATSSLSLCTEQKAAARAQSSLNNYQQHTNACCCVDGNKPITWRTMEHTMPLTCYSLLYIQSPPECVSMPLYHQSNGNGNAWKQLQRRMQTWALCCVIINGRIVSKCVCAVIWARACIIRRVNESETMRERERFVVVFCAPNKSSLAWLSIFQLIWKRGPVLCAWLTITECARSIPTLRHLHECAIRIHMRSRICIMENKYIKELCMPRAMADEQKVPWNYFMYMFKADVLWAKSIVQNWQ